ncbi:MAG: hypothetical protein P4L46_12920 [Fimbriimonas sp.]|nr:hypothetical protein [Fimbriimonas sp.]
MGTRRIANWTKVGGMGLIAVMAATLIAAQDGAYEPNYAKIMLTPYKGSNVAPRLAAARHRFPLKVIVLEDGVYFNAHYFEIVKSACDAWTKATKNVAQGGVTLACTSSNDPKNADVIFRFGTMRDSFGFDGFTSEQGSFALIRLAVRDDGNLPVAPDRLKRIAMHEFGHALGIWGHSPNPNDIMSLDEDTRSISTADVNTLLIAYSKAP